MRPVHLIVHRPPHDIEGGELIIRRPPPHRDVTGERLSRVFLSMTYTERHSLLFYGPWGLPLTGGETAEEPPFGLELALETTLCMESLSLSEAAVVGSSFSNTSTAVSNWRSRFFAMSSGVFST